MAYYRTCPDCGAALDPGESCDCNRRSFQATPIREMNKKEKKQEEKNRGVRA